jgi:ADP-ribosylation factor-binding protein GGA
MSQTYALSGLLDEIADAPGSEMDWGRVRVFCDKIHGMRDVGDALLSILDKIQSRNANVALRALTLLEAVVKNCGLNVHAYIGKFRFLNELIRLISPKHSHNTAPEVRERCLMLIQQWNFNIPDMGKIREAYQMLKKQGAQFPVEHTPPLPVPAGLGFLDVSAESLADRKSPLEEDQRKAKLLAKLLQSKDPNDLIKANRLIKRMVNDDAKKSERTAEMHKDLELARNNSKVLLDMLEQFNPATDGRLQHNEIIFELFRSCTELRPKLAKIASETPESDDNLSAVLAANDDLTRALDLFDDIRSRQSAGGAGAAATAAPTLSVLGPAPSSLAPVADSSRTRTASVGQPDSSLIDLDFMGPARTATASLEDDFLGLGLSGNFGSSAAVAAAPTVSTVTSNGNANGGGNSGLDLLGDVFGAPAQQ